LESEVQVVDSTPSSVDPTLPLKSEVKVVNQVSSSVDPTLPLKSEIKVVEPSSSSVNPTLPLESDIRQVIDLIPSSVDPTLSLESEVDTAHVFLVNTDSSVQGVISPSIVQPPPSSEAIIFNWHALIGPRLPSYIPFQISIQVCGRDIPHNIFDGGASINIRSLTSWKGLRCPHLVLVTQNMLDFNKQIT
jgi:hypothetical protein